MDEGREIDRMIDGLWTEGGLDLGIFSCLGFPEEERRGG